jgi:hypothetical protein
VHLVIRTRKRRAGKRHLGFGYAFDLDARDAAVNALYGRRYAMGLLVVVVAGRRRNMQTVDRPWASHVHVHESRRTGFAGVQEQYFMLSEPLWAAKLGPFDEDR